MRNLFGIRDKLIEKRKAYNPNKGGEVQKHICAILYKGNVLGIGANRHIPRSRLRTIHAETDVINKYIHKLENRKVDMFVIRTTMNNSKSCANCLSSMFSAPLKIKNVYFTNGENNIEKVHFNELYNSNDKHVSSYNSLCSGHSESSFDGNGCCSEDEDEEEGKGQKRRSREALAYIGNLVTI